MEITVNIPAIDRLAEAITGLARKLPATEMQEKLPVAETKTLDPATSNPTPSPTIGVPAAPAPVAPTTAMPIAPVAPTTAMPIAPAPAVPVSAPSYTLEQLSLAARQLADSGRMADVQQLVAQFGVQTMTQIPTDRYGDFATALRGLGARI